MKTTILRHTPEQYWPVTLFALFLILLQPIFSVAHYSWNEEMGAYPIHADSIGIPITNEIMAWMIFAPIASVGAGWALFRYPGSISLAAWNGNRPIWSVFWSIIFALLLLAVFLDIPFNVRWINLPSLLNDCLWLLLFFQLRALVVMKRGWL